MTERRQHPTVSDVALALAVKQRSERLTKVTHTNANARGVVQTTIEVSDPDSKVAYETSVNLMKLSLVEFGDPRENGATK